MYILIIILTVIVALLLIGIVLIQKSKGGGLSSQFGAAGNVMGVAQTNKFLEKGTWYLAGIIALLSILSAYTLPKIGQEVRTKVTNTNGAAPAGNQYDANVPPLDVNAAAQGTSAN